MSKTEDIYLGDKISTKGLEASDEATIAQRQGKIKGETYEMKATWRILDSRQ